MLCVVQSVTRVSRNVQNFFPSNLYGEEESWGEVWIFEIDLFEYPVVVTLGRVA